MDSNEIKQLLDKYLNGESTLVEESLLKNWFAKQVDIPKELAWAGDIFGYVQNKSSNSNKYKTRSLVTYAVAASVAIMVSIFFIEKNTNNVKTFTNTGKEVVEYQLDENCHVWLNHNTTIHYSAKNIITVGIDGEAFFEIKGTDNFTYKIQAFNAIINSETESAFNVKAYNSLQSIEIAVGEGTLKISESENEDGVALLVDKGKYCSVHRSSKVMYSSVLTNNNYLAWKTGELNFTNQPLKTVTDALAEYYNVNITINNRDLGLCAFTGSFKNKSIESVLEEIQKEAGFRITNTGTGFSLSGGSCFTN